MQRNPQMTTDDQQDVHRDDREGVPQPVGNVVVQGEMPYPRHIDAPNYNVVHYNPPPPPYPEVPYMHVHRDVRVAEAVPAQAHPFAPGVQENYDGLFGYAAAADPPEAFPGVQPHPAPPGDMPPGNGLRNLASRYLNNPGTHVNMLRIEPGPGGRFDSNWPIFSEASIHCRKRDPRHRPRCSSFGERKSELLVYVLSSSLFVQRFVCRLFVVAS